MTSISLHLRPACRVQCIDQAPCLPSALITHQTAYNQPRGRGYVLHSPISATMRALIYVNDEAGLAPPPRLRRREGHAPLAANKQSNKQTKQPPATPRRAAPATPPRRTRSPPRAAEGAAATLAAWPSPEVPQCDGHQLLVLVACDHDVCACTQRDIGRKLAPLLRRRPRGGHAALQHRVIHLGACAALAPRARVCSEYRKHRLGALALCVGGGSG